jgi:hypothetical protein
MGEKGQKPPGPQPPSDAERRQRIQACINAIQGANLGAQGARAIQLLRGILAKGEISDDDFALAQSICRETLGPGN